jgi:PAS domain S-box-containing protein
MKAPLKIASCIALSGMLLTGVAFGVARHLLIGSFWGKLTADVSTRARIVQQKLEEDVLIAEAASSFVRASGRPAREVFAVFTGHFLEDTTGLTALSLVAVVPAAERAHFEATARELSGKVDYRLYEGVPGVTPLPVGERDTYYPVLFTNTRVPSAVVILGYDLGSSPSRRSALERARDSGEAMVTERITLVGTAGMPGFIIFAPVYDAGRPTATVAERRAALTGFVQAIFNLDDVIATAFNETPSVGLPFDLLDLSTAQGRQVICSWAARLSPAATWRSAFIPAGIRILKTFSFAGREWGIDAQPNASYLENTFPIVHWLILPVGLTLTFIFAAYFFTVLSKREELVALNGELELEIARRSRVEAALRTSEEKYRFVADNTYEWEFWLDPKGALVYSSPSSERITGYSSAAFLEDPALLGRIIVPDDAESFSRHRHEVTSAREIATLVFRIRHRDGSVRWIDHVCQAVFDGNGCFAGTRGSNRDITEKKRYEEEREHLITGLQQAQLSIRTLEGILPICASCKKIRDEQDNWIQVESYVTRRTNAAFTHSICPECVKELYPDFAERGAAGDTPAG